MSRVKIPKIRYSIDTAVNDFRVAFKKIGGMLSEAHPANYNHHDKKIEMRTISTLFLCFLLTSLNAQSTYVKVFDYPTGAVIIKSAALLKGGLLVVGKHYCAPAATTDYDHFLALYNAAGNQINFSQGASGADELINCIAPATDSGFYAAGAATY